LNLMIYSFSESSSLGHGVYGIEVIKLLQGPTKTGDDQGS